MRKIVLSSLFFILLSTFLVANIYSALTISPLLGALQEKDFDGVVGYLRSIRGLPQFSEEYKQYQRLYGQRLYVQVFQEDLARKQEVLSLENILQKNPQSRDALYHLYLKHKEEGDLQKAQEYLKRAKAVDPMVQ